MAVPPEATVNSSALPSSSAANKPPASSRKLHRVVKIFATFMYRLKDLQYQETNLQ